MFNCEIYCESLGNPPQIQGAAFDAAPKGRRASRGAPLGFVVVYLVTVSKAIAIFCRFLRYFDCFSLFLLKMAP